MPRGQPRSNVRRANVTACTRCKSRKQRCDQRIPACSNCERAGVECVSTDTDGSTVPRSYVKSLEDHVAFLEAQISARGAQPSQSSSPDFILSTTDLNTASSSALLHEAREESQDLVDQIASSCMRQQPFSTVFRSPDGLSTLNSLLSGPVSELSVPEKSDGRSLLDEIPPETMSTLPRRETVTKLLDVYFEHCEFFSPILSSRQEFVQSVELLYENSTADQSLANIRYRAMIVFATSVLLLNRVDFTVPSSKAERFFNTAIRIFSQNTDLTCTGDLNHLENLLFIIQYCCFAANITAAWHFLGLATRLAVELNLQKETACLLTPHPSQSNHRRWLFWTMYTFERNLCVIIGRPFSIPDGAIETPLPVQDPQRALAIHLLKYRLLESEIYSILNERQYHRTSFTKDTWRENMHQRLQEWHSSTPSVHKSTHLTPMEIFNGSFLNGLVLLYYPSRPFPSPTAENMTVLTRSATDAIACYKDGFRSGELRFFWRTVHNLFRSGVAIVYCAHQNRINRVSGFDPESTRMSINSCSSLLWGMVERYPAGQAYRDIFDKLANSVLSQKDGAGGMGHEVSFETPGPLPILDDITLGADASLLSSSAFDLLFMGFTPS
ncbi:fungal-specific transcription factor domain-containing protein [Penicillium cataractarum]|uniref:Fungal-specific transcription factor domain-containing protein n=1 Tax=Penicillium cataractarum TaxID=2100454 RepID=A0A9X0B702_9EURO|nr:fungal-specific transcription factor domain-containing protein [Penicillium cataractarum]KAJ5390441.1 fungal-specific transcription factor domain-containing protein [Penicillium cataractarum]